LVGAIYSFIKSKLEFYPINLLQSFHMQVKGNMILVVDVDRKKVLQYWKAIYL